MKIDDTGATRTLWYRGDITDDSMGKLFDEFNRLSKEDPIAPVTLYVMSNGGFYGGAFTLYSHVTKMLKLPVQTIACSYVKSAAPILFMMGEKRFIDPGTIFFFHEFARTYEKAKVNVTWHDRVARELEADQEKYVSLIASKSKLKKRELRRLMKNEANVTADEAIEMGLAHAFWK